MCIMAHCNMRISGDSMASPLICTVKQLYISFILVVAPDVGLNNDIQSSRPIETLIQQLIEYPLVKHPTAVIKSYDH